MDRDGLQQLYLRYSRELYLYIYSICKDPATAEDLLQETFLRAILSLPDDIRNVRAWLYRVAKNLCFNHLKVHSKITSDDGLQELTAEDDVLDKLLAEERNQALYRAVSQLPLVKREVLTLQYFGGLSQKEIAAVLQMTPENVRVLAHRAKKDLKKRMEGDL